MPSYIKEYIADPTMSGEIQLTTGFTPVYVVSPGVNPRVGADILANPDVFWRGYFSYDTSNIPDSATITQVRWKLSIVSILSYQGPTNWRNDIYFGTWIGGSLDSSDWGGGNFNQRIDWPGLPGGPADGWITLKNASHAQVNKAGYTDLAFWDSSHEDWPYGWWQVGCYLGTVRACKLEVTYDYAPVIHQSSMVASNWGR